MKTYVKQHWPALLLVALAVAVVYALGTPFDAAIAGAVLANGAGAITEPDLKALKEVMDNQGRAWEEFKKTNDDLLKAKADGKAVSDLEAKLDKLEKEIDKHAEIKAQVDEVIAKLNRPKVDGDPKDVAAEVKSFNLMRRAGASQGASVADIDVDTYSAYKNAFWGIFRKGNVELLSGDERKALSAGSDPDGGYLLPAPTAGRVITRVFELSPIRQISNVMTISTDALEGIDDTGEASGGWVAETGGRTDSTTPTVGKYRIEAAELYSMPKATQKLLDDAAIDIEAWLANKVSSKFARLEGAAFITGNGVGQPRGFTTYTTAATADATRAWGQLEHVKSGANGDFAATSPADVLFDLIQAFKPEHLNNARWVTLRTVIAKIRKFKEATTNAYMWQPGLQQGQPDKLLGFPIVNAQDMPALATDSLSLSLGDFMESYQIVDRIGIRTLRDPFTAKPYVVFYTTKRTGGGVVNFDAIKFIKFSA